MARAGLGRPIGLRGQDRQAAINLHAVGVDDLAAELFGERDSQRRFAARGRPTDHQHRQIVAGHSDITSALAHIVTRPRAIGVIAILAIPNPANHYARPWNMS